LLESELRHARDCPDPDRQQSTPESNRNGHDAAEDINDALGGFD
jgi:hypothetical protein